jgi:glyceraldehyde-3-phosphate dehydrogenase type I
MTIRLAINGYGRIGRCILRALYESEKRDEMRIVAINEPADVASMAHLTRYDSTHGRFSGSVAHDSGALWIEGDPIAVFHQKKIIGLPWADLGVDLVMECSGHWIRRQDVEIHRSAGARKVLLSCPGEPDMDATVVFGLNETTLTGRESLVSNASCTTNCICHVIHALDEALGIAEGVITTTHSMMNDQPVIDAYHHRDLRRTRSSGFSIIPAETGLARGIERILPHLRGCFQAVSLRVPTMNVSLMQLTARVKKGGVCQQEVNAILEAAASRKPGILGYTEERLVSCDYNHDTRSAIVDGTQTSVCGENLLTVMAWFDNEWGYANRMLDTAGFLMRAGERM